MKNQRYKVQGRYFNFFLGGKFFFKFSMPPDYWKIGKKQHFICSSLTLFIVPFFLSFFFLCFLSFFFFLSFFLFFFFLGGGGCDGPPAPPPPQMTLLIRSYFRAPVTSLAADIWLSSPTSDWARPNLSSRLLMPRYRELQKSRRLAISAEGQGRARKGRAGQGRTGRGRTGRGGAGRPGRVGPGRAGPGQARRGKAGQDRAGQERGMRLESRAGQGRAGQDRGCIAEY